MAGSTIHHLLYLRAKDVSPDFFAWHRMCRTQRRVATKRHIALDIEYYESVTSSAEVSIREASVKYSVDPSPSFSYGEVGFAGASIQPTSPSSPSNLRAIGNYLASSAVAGASVDEIGHALHLAVENEKLQEDLETLVMQGSLQRRGVGRGALYSLTNGSLGS